MKSLGRLDTFSICKFIEEFRNEITYVSFYITNENELLVTKQNDFLFENYSIGDSIIVNQLEPSFKSFVSKFERNKDWIEDGLISKKTIVLNDKPGVIAMKYKVALTDSVLQAISLLPDNALEWNSLEKPMQLSFYLKDKLLIEINSRLMTCFVSDEHQHISKVLKDKRIIKLHDFSSEGLAFHCFDEIELNRLLDYFLGKATHISFTITGYSERCTDFEKRTLTEVHKVDSDAFVYQNYEEIMENIFKFLVEDSIASEQDDERNSNHSDSVYILNLTSKICNIIKSYDIGLFEWLYPAFPENLCFYNNDVIIFETISHEKIISVPNRYQYIIDELYNLGIIYSNNN